MPMPARQPQSGPGRPVTSPCAQAFRRLAGAILGFTHDAERLLQRRHQLDRRPLG